jgi:hypothetical protein
MTIEFTPINKSFDDLPLLSVKPAPMSDSDVDFHSDILYMRGLLDWLYEQADTTGRAQDIPPPWSDQLQAAITELKTLTVRVREFNRER